MTEPSTTAGSIRRNSLIATIAIIGSRVFGLVREQVFAFFFGAGLVQDAYITAFRIPNLFRDLFAEGALSQSFVAVFAQKAGHDDANAWRLANKVLTFILLLLGAITVLGIVFSPHIVSWLAPGFTGEKLALTVSLNRLLFPFILFASLAALFMGMLNAKHRFFLPQSASTFFNITSIIVGVSMAYSMAPDYMGVLLDKFLHPGGAQNLHNRGMERAILGMAIGTLFGGLVQWLIQAPTLSRLGYRMRLDFGFKDPLLVKVLKMTVPAIIGGAAVQVNVLVNQNFASQLGDGSVSYLSYAFRLMQFPLGVFGVALATASAPALARLVAQGQLTDFRTTVRAALRMSVFLSLPSTVGLMVLAEPIVSVIFEHGKFGALDALGTIYALEAYSLGIVSYSLIKIYQPAYLSFHDSRTPMFISLLSIVFNFTINWFFVAKLHMEHWGLALGTAIVATLNLVLLGAFFRRKIEGIWDKALLLALFKMAFASAVMGFSCWWVWDRLKPAFLQDSNLLKIGVLILAILPALPAYFGTAALLKLEDATGFIKLLQRRIRRS